MTTTIFYWKTQGTPSARPIYGVHPSGVPVKGGVPNDVAVFEVINAPDAIAWPPLSGGRVGTERSSAVNTTTTPPTLVVHPAAESQEDAVADAALSSKGLKALALALGTHPALGLTAQQIRQRFLAAWRTLP